MKKSEFLRFRIDIRTHKLLMKHCEDHGTSVSQVLRKLLSHELAQHPAMVTTEAPRYSPSMTDPIGRFSAAGFARVLAGLLLSESSILRGTSDERLGDDSFTETVEILERLLQILLGRQQAKASSSPTLLSARNGPHIAA